MFKHKMIVFIVLVIALIALPLTLSAKQEFLSKRVRNDVKKEFKQITGNVTLVVFTQKVKCNYCVQNDQLLDEVANLSSKIKVEEHDFEKDALTAQNYDVDKIPAMVPIGKKDYGIRFFGVPTGYEFSNLIEAIKDVSRGTTDLDEDTIARLKKIKKPVQIEVLVTPTCPYCTKMVRLSHQFAMHSDKIRADMVEVTEFPTIAQKYQVVGVPMTVINGKTKLTGLISLEKLLAAVEKAGK